MKDYLESGAIIDWEHPDILTKARELAEGDTEVISIAGRTFEWVRDEIAHSADYCRNPVTCTASEVLHHKTGFCYAKSHLLAALLRANGIPTGFCYQRFSINSDGAPYCLHGLNAIMLPGIGWYRVDPRGNKEGVDAQFNPAQEQLAFSITVPGEFDFPEVWPRPLPHVVEALQHYSDYSELSRNLPDVEIVGCSGSRSASQGTPRVAMRP